MYTSFNARALGLSLSARSTLDLAARHGFGGVDLLVRDLLEAGDDPAEIRSRMDGLGLLAGAWPLPVDWRGDEATFRRDLAALPRYARAAETLSLSRTGTWVLPASPGPPEMVVDWHTRRLTAMARVLSDHGTRLGLEVIGVESFREGRGQPLFHRLAGREFEGLLHRVREEVPGVGVVLDAFHLYAGHEENGWESGGMERVVWVHVADLPRGSGSDRAAIRDGERGLPGEHGAVDCRRILMRLKELHYQGPITAEPMAGCRTLQGLTPDQVASRVAATLASVWPHHQV